MEIRVGDTITWDNQDVETPHTISFGPPAGPGNVPYGNAGAFSGTERRANLY